MLCRMILAVLLLNFICRISFADLQTAEVATFHRNESDFQEPLRLRRLLESSGSNLYKKRRKLGTERFSDGCTKADLSIYQGRSSPLPNGIPTYTVQIINLCVAAACPLSTVHISCGWFASAKLVNPKIFRRVGFNDCLVNDGKPIAGGESIFFHYANSFQYPMRVQSAKAC